MHKIAAFIQWEFDDVFLAVSAARFDFMAFDSDLEKHLNPPKNKPVRQHAVNF